MVELFVPNLEKWIHSFVQNLTFQVSPICSKKMDKINFTCHVDANYHMNSELTVKMLKDIAKKILDITDVQIIYHFIKRQTNFLNKCIYSESIFLSMYHHNHINKKIMQSIRDIKINKSMRKWQTIFYKTKSSKLKLETLNDYDQMYSKKTAKIMSNEKSGDLLVRKPKIISYHSKKFSVTKSIVAYINQETVLNERYLQLYVNDIEFIKNMHIILYIASKTLYDVKYHSNILHLKQNKKRLDYQHVLMLCEHAILCLIDPSEKAFVYVENDLSVIIQNHLLQGYIYHFDSTSNIENSSALLVLSERAKLLVKHPNTIMLRSISAILRCNIYDVLVLSYHLDDENIYYE